MARRLAELERENEHLHDEVDVLYMQVDEQSLALEGVAPVEDEAGRSTTCAAHPRLLH